MVHHRSKPEHQKVTHRMNDVRRHPQTVIMRGLLNGALSPQEAFKDMKKFIKPHMVLAAGQLALELAHQEVDVIQQATWLEKARQAFGSLEHLATPAKPMRQPYAARAVIELAQLPNHIAMCASGELPTTSVARRAFGSTIPLGQRLDEGNTDSWQEEPHAPESTHLSGILAETAVLLLGQRYAISTHPDQTWFPLFAYGSEDNHQWRRSTSGNAWDINVFTDTGDGPQETYKVQVKAGESRSSVADYDESITVLHVNPDLRLRHDVGSIGGVIINELAMESAGDAAASTRLDERTQKLLDILG